MRPLPHDVQRDLAFYRTLVAFRNAVERMQVARGAVDDAGQMPWWWGFGYLGRPRGDDGTTDRDRPDGIDPRDDGDGPAGSRVPRRPPGGAGAAGADAEIEHEVDLEAFGVRQAPAP